MIARIWRTATGAAVELDGSYRELPDIAWNNLVQHDDPIAWIVDQAAARPALPEGWRPDEAVAPIQDQEVWAAGVTYLRSRSARMEEAAESGGADFYDRVYTAARPELFFKATAHRVAGPGEAVRIRRDSQWNVPEPELTACVTSAGRIFGYTIGNDVSSRDIEGENPLYLPQAKVFDRCCALGPCILLQYEPLPETTEIAMQIQREGAAAFAGVTRLHRMKRSPDELVEYLFRDNSFPRGCFLLTGTGIVPPQSFTLQSGDEVRIAIERIGVLVNTVG